MSTDEVAIDRFHFDENDQKLTHYLFRYPAKFHPPVVRQLIREMTIENERILDPFSGSGTSLVEAAALGRKAIGTDIDPLAVFVSRVKTHRFNCSRLRSDAAALDARLRTLARSDYDYECLQFEDISRKQFKSEADSLWLPQIPNLFHWFRKYVVVDLGRIMDSILTLETPETHRDFFRLCFASIIRGASNADPVPVSGLEVTSHMKKRDKDGRLVNPFALFRRALNSGLAAAEAYAQSTAPYRVSVTAVQADARRLRSRVRTKVDAVITSPPYHNAVDYYRRHQLEMYWLQLTPTQAHRLKLKHRYIGRDRVSVRDPLLNSSFKMGPLASDVESTMRATSVKRADAFRHYIASMAATMHEVRHVLSPGKLAGFVIGHSQWNGAELSTSELLTEVASPQLELLERRWYPIKNRYMSYKRHNGASIDREFVLIFKPTSTR